MRVIDCQAHLHNRSYFESHVGRREHPLAERDGDGYVFHASDANAISIPRHYWDPELQLEQLDAQGIDTVVSSMGAFTVDHLPVRQAVDLACHINTERSELERRFPGRFYGLALLPMQDDQCAIETLDHAIETLALRGVCIGSNVNGDSVAAPERRAVYRRIADLGVPLFLHPTRTVLEQRVRRYGHEYTVGFMVDTSLAALDLIFSGVLDECPTLQVVHPHLGGILPYLAARIDIEYGRPWTGAATLERPPSEYLRRFFTDTVSNSPGALRLSIETYGVERLLFSTDYPYWSASDALDFMRAQLDDDDLDAVVGGNAAGLLGLDR